MKKFEIDVDINGTITFEVEAKNRKEAQAKVEPASDKVSKSVVVPTVIKRLPEISIFTPESWLGLANFK